ncbi:MAG TPA: hypothetical protein VNE41_00100 [Chitinophagaceae bacterium]|nr:hypothetical protein [Chitinophagaceae bacterium]
MEYLYFKHGLTIPGKLLLMTGLLFFSAIPLSQAQGCIAIRSTGTTFVMSQEHASLDTTTSWIFNANNRYFKSFRHFIGDIEQKQRQTMGTEVINHQYTLDLSITHILKNPRWSVFADLPILSNSRSSLYEHHNVGRFKTYSFGIGDIRVAAYGWLINPRHFPLGNVQVGLGIKLPTGNDDYQDYFHLTDTSLILGPVDQSIQLGDGGTGITAEINAYYTFSHVLSAYGNFFYLLNPMDVNGVSTTRGGMPSPASVANTSSVMSVPDQYMVRGGVNLSFNDLLISLGLKDECLPVHDLIGGSDGFRRPGYIISVEPGITYNIRKTTLYAFLPVAIVRNRTQSVPDIITTKMTGVYTHGDAAFADYVINVGYSYTF